MSDLDDSIDEIVDDMNPDRLESVMEQYELTLNDVLRRIENEIKARLTGLTK